MIEGSKCYLRALEPQDVDLMYLWENDVEIWLAGDSHKPVSRSDIESLILQSDLDVYQTRQMRLMICSLDGEAIGCVDMFDFDPRNMHCGVGVLVDGKYRRQGYAEDAIMAFVRYLFDCFDMHVVCASMRSSNIASKQLFSACGFEVMGIKREWLKVGSEFEDEVLMGLVNRC